MSSPGPSWKEKDEKVISWIEKTPSLQTKEWAKSQYNGLVTINNPYYDAIIENHNDLSGNPTITLMTKEATDFNYKKVTYHVDVNENKPKQVFRSELDSSTVETLPIENLQSDAPTAVAQAKPESYDLLAHDLPKITPVPKEEYLSVSFSSCKIDFDIFEPITYSIFILEDNNIVSETWNTFDPLFKMYLGNEYTKNALFNIRHVQNAYLVVVCNRSYQIDNGAYINKYYRKITTANREKAFSSFAPVYQKLKGYWQTFAFTFIPLSEIHGGTVTMPKLYLAECESKAMTGEFIAQQIERAKLLKLYQIAYEIRFDIQRSEYANPNQIKNAVVCYSKKPYDMWPILSHTHKLVINLRAAKFSFPPKVSARNIVVDVSYLYKGQYLKCIRNRWENTKIVDHAVSRGLYHVTNPQFEDEFIIELPYPVEGIVVFTFQRLSTKPNDEACFTFGNSSFEISPNHDNFLIPDGEMNLGISYGSNINPKEQPTKDNCFTISTKLVSSLVTNQPTLKSVYSGALAVPKVQDIPVNVLANNMYSVMDSILTNIKLDPKLALKSIFEFDKLVDVLPNRQILVDYLNTYNRVFAFRQNSHHDPQTHKYLLKEWATYIFETANSYGTNRKELVLVEFLFEVILKSIIFSNDRDFHEDIEKFAQTWAVAVGILTFKVVAEAQAMNRCFSTFVLNLIDLKLYSAATSCITIFANHIGNDPPQHRMLANFLEMTLHPLLFLGETVANNDLVIVFTSLLQTAITKLPDGPICQIFNILCRTLSFVPEDMKSDVSASFIPLMKLFTNKMQGSNESLIAPLSFAIFVLKNSRVNTLETRYNSLDEKEKKSFIDFVHFLLVKTKYIKDVLINDSTARNKAFSSIERQIEQRMQAAYNTGSGDRYGSVSESSTHSVQTQPPVAKKRSFAVARKANNIPSVGSSSLQMPIKYNYPQRDVALEAQFAAIRVVDDLLSIDLIDIAIDILYHLLSMNLCLNAIDCLTESLKLLLTKDVKKIIECKTLPFALFIKKLLQLAACNNVFIAKSIISTFDGLFKSEEKSYGNNNRTHALFMRAVSLLPVNLISPDFANLLSENVKHQQLKEIAETIKRIAEIDDKLHKIDNNCFASTFETQTHVGQKIATNALVEDFGDLLWERCLLFKYSPDACLEALRTLDQFHYANGYELESITCKISELALLSEYLTAFNLMPQKLGFEHAAKAFVPMTPTAEVFVMPQEYSHDLPKNLPTFCDSSFFNESGVMLVLTEICDYCRNHQVFEIANEVIRLFVPLLESHQMYTELDAIFSRSQKFYEQLDTMPTQGERLMGRYYRVIFYGNQFGEDNGKIYIYREQKLTNLFNLTKRMEDTYTPIIGRGKLEIIKESKPVDPRLLDPEKGYIQITFVTPTYFEGEEVYKQTTFEQNSHIKVFCFATPFMKGSNKLQGSVSSQWLRKTVLKINTEMPSTKKRIVVNPEDVENIEIEPIKVSIHHLEDRLKQYDAAIEANNISQIQPLLNGSLCVQVNDGPIKMAEVFLTEKKRTLLTEHMRKLFRQFIDVNKKALEIHRKFSQGNKDNLALQDEMDKGFDNLKSKLAQYL
ncbi:Dedicator of cytokinesis family protein [Trichomonas vaginalis G3]|uniref:Dedicator of cytokinesis family protein n=1 Tax=Trichomonas vaginalis (strain ATCC PRA-98 / G3) TaxID=412133 RepID=A2G6I2_TRIV3|nr:dedicator of cytokinesis DOCK family [Trichomonas vaginalis G3]EAX87232.1 Dedicator of cytokinesis family protein [Trichomonas vaginalis G3]KAI5511270.1 dedicator of cytokinesis DOCK family [Trichomonas vaginalis G3]|eukprot:XP_001300162.1 Dedicator of cytokinesis family protein [Trichomonas vaginalis G3]